MGDLQGSGDGDSIDSIVVNFSKLLKQLECDSPSGRCSSKNSTSKENNISKLRNLHAEITEIQEGIEKFKLFKEGQDLYTKWIPLGEQNEGALEDLIALSYNNRGYLKYLQVDFKGALEDYTLAIKHNPALPCAYYNRGLVTYRLAFFEQAIQDMKTAVNLDPSKDEFHEGLKKVSEMIGSPTGHKFKLNYGDIDET